ncbi:MAG: hypothetical protein ACFBRM_16245 [Pikeienuella sp.]
MGTQDPATGGENRIDDMLTSIRLPLENLEFTIEAFLLANGARLDTETRILLAGVRDCVGRVAVSSRRLETREQEARTPRAAAPARWDNVA